MIAEISTGGGGDSPKMFDRHHRGNSYAVDFYTPINGYEDNSKFIVPRGGQ